MPNPPLLLDACVTINLVAAGPIHQIARSVGRSCLITRQAANEVGHLRETTDGETRVTPVNLTDHVQTGAFEIIDLAPDEIPLFVELASLVDDGEASTIAVAIKRGIPLATDDRKARRLCAERGLAHANSSQGRDASIGHSRNMSTIDVKDTIGVGTSIL